MAAVVPEISVIVPVRDGARSLPQLLDSLAAQTLGTDRFEVVVVDNASRDATARVADEGGARVVSEPIPNRSRARNRGAAAARADLFAFTDADCVADPGWLEALMACPREVPLLAGPVRVTTADRPNAVERFETLWRFSQEAWVQHLGWAATANLRVRRDAFEAVGGFDPAYRHVAEDVDFCLRAYRAGHPLGLCADALVLHHAERDLAPMLRRVFFHGYSASQVWYRTGVGQRAWREPAALVSGRAALSQIGLTPETVPSGDAVVMGRLARAAFAARVLGSLWAEASRAR